MHTNTHFIDPSISPAEYQEPEHCYVPYFYAIAPTSFLLCLHIRHIPAKGLVLIGSGSYHKILQSGGPRQQSFTFPILEAEKSWDWYVWPLVRALFLGDGQVPFCWALIQWREKGLQSSHLLSKRILTPSQGLHFHDLI